MAEAPRRSGAGSYDDAVPDERLITYPPTGSGVPCVRDTGIPVSTVVRRLADGASTEELVADLRLLTTEDVRASLLFAAEAVESRPPPSEPDPRDAEGVQPADLVAFGDRYHWPAAGPYAEETVTLTATPGPTLVTGLGMVTLADPWFPQGLDSSHTAMLGRPDQPVVLTTVTRTTSAGPATTTVAASVGDLDAVRSWRPALGHEVQAHVDVDSALCAFYDAMEEAALLPLFEDSRHMQGVYDRALTETVVPLEADGRVLGVAFLCPDGAGLYPVWTGYGGDMSAVAALVDLKLLRAGERVPPT